MPATKSRISASSSTIKISAAMVLLAYALLLFWLSGVGFAGGGNPHPHPGPPLARDFLGGIAQFDRAPVLLNNAPHDGKSEARALLAGRDIGLEQSAAILVWQTGAVGDDIDHDIVAIPRGVDLDHTFTEFAGRHCRNRLGCILDGVGQRLRNQASVKTCRHGVFGDIGVDVDFRISYSHQE